MIPADDIKPADSSHSISVVVPVFKCCACLDDLVARLEKTLEKLTPRYEIILVDDRSPDGAWAKIQSLRTKHPALRGARLSRNFGQHIAIAAGLEAAQGDVAVVLDCDLQDPPELIAELYAKFRQGHELVLARRAIRTHSFVRNLAARFYFGLLNRVTREKLDGAYGCYSMFSRKVIDAYLRFEERDRYHLFILRWLGFDAATIDYEQQKRLSGKSSYSLRRLLDHAMSGIFFQTTAVLQWIIGVGLTFALAGLLWAVFLIYRYFLFEPPPGFTTLSVLLLVSTGLIVTSLGIVGLYIGRIFEHTKRRPLYAVDATIDRATEW